MRPQKVLILGLGHLASFLVKEFDEAIELWGTHRAQHAGTAFERVNTVRYASGDIISERLVQNWSVVIWNLPPIDNYAEILGTFNSSIPGVCPWIFVSSTAVYGAGDITEQSTKQGQRPAGKRLVAIEATLMGFNRDISIIRPAGLVDSVRNPANFLKGTPMASGAGTPVNLVHTQDVARFIVHLIDNDLFAGSFNLVSDSHPSRKDFYSAVMRRNGMSPPKFNSEGSVHRVVSNLKSKNTGFKYFYPDLLSYFTDA